MREIQSNESWFLSVRHNYSHLFNLLSASNVRGILYIDDRRLWVLILFVSLYTFQTLASLWSLAAATCCSFNCETSISRVKSNFFLKCRDARHNFVERRMRYKRRQWKRVFHKFIFYSARRRPITYGSRSHTTIMIQSNLYFNRIPMIRAQIFSLFKSASSIGFA